MKIEKVRSNLLPLKNEQNLLSMQGLASRSPQLDSSSREEMYYPIRDPIRWSAARATPPRYPHVQLNEDFLSLILQVRRKWLVGFPAARRRGGGYGGEIPAGPRQATAGERRVEGEGGGG